MHIMYMHTYINIMFLDKIKSGDENCRSHSRADHLKTHLVSSTLAPSPHGSGRLSISAGMSQDPGRNCGN